MRRALLPSLLAAACLAGCGETTVTATHPAAYESAETSVPARATASLGLRILRRLGHSNIVFSPDSVAAAVAMAGVGARGQTASQIVRTLGAGSTSALPSFGALQSRIIAEQQAASRGTSEPEKLSVADTVFVQSRLALEQPFLSSLQGGFGATPQNVDFARDPTGAARAINEWVSSHTEGVIPSIASSLPPATVMALANAVYLKALWASEFRGSHDAPFHAPAHSSSVPFMTQTESFPYARGHGFSAVSLPYAGSTLSMLVLLPDRGGAAGISDLQRTLTADELASLTSRMSSRPVEASLPRFHIAAREELSAVLSALGMPLAFSEAADFSGITRAEQLRLGKVLHAADIRVDERGTTAAAATVVTIEPTSAEAPPPHVVHFDANRPFLFFLRDRRTGAVLFAGRLVDAAAAGTSGA